MVLQYPKLSETASVIHYGDYRKMHHQYMQQYQKLYEDVAVFSTVPEKFVMEAEPVIDDYLSLYTDKSTEEGRLGLIKITDFMSRFHTFMDEATEMFIEHQSLSEQTYDYLVQLSEIGRKNEGRRLLECEEDYLELIPALENLNSSFDRVRATVNTTVDDMEKLGALWADITRRLNGKSAGHFFY